MKELEYPIDSEGILKKSKKIKRMLLEDGRERIQKRIAVLGGSTTHDIIRTLELFLLDYGIEAQFYESEFGQYYQDAMFPNEELEQFAPDLIIIHTSSRNLTAYPGLTDSEAEAEQLLLEQYRHFEGMWDRLLSVYRCPIIQNNFEFPPYRLMGNLEATDCHGKVYFISELNRLVHGYARNHENFFVHDIHYLSASYGLDQWADPFYWHMYKYALSMQAIPSYAHSLGKMIKALYGKNKKALVLDLDNTLWGGVVGDDGVNNLEIGNETSMGQVYEEFQQYIRQHKELGILLCVNSKNDFENAVSGLQHPAGVLRPEDFVVIQANWESKDRNMMEIASQLSILPESLVFVDDNPAEREIVAAQIPGAAVPEMGTPESYMRILDHSGFFEVMKLSEEDKKRNEMYQANRERQKQQAAFADYGEFLLSLQMEATIRPFEPVYYSRIAQLTNKSNQFNLTTKRYTQAEIEGVAESPEYLTLYGSLTDKFGDNGVVSVVIGRKEEEVLHLDLWLMSCRVLKREMEQAMMDEVARVSKAQGIQRIRGYYYKTAKNAMVRELYGVLGFKKVKEEEDGSSQWELVLPEAYVNQNKVITIKEEENF